MFSLFRSREKSQKVILSVLLGLVAVSMLIYLIPGGYGGGGTNADTTVAKVGDEQITVDEVQRAIANITRNRPNIPKAYLAMFVPSMVNDLISAKAMAYKARQMGLRVSDEELSNAIQTEFAASLGGKFDMAVYNMYIEQQGMTVPDFEKQRRESMLAMRLEALQAQAIVTTDAQARAEYQRKNQKVALEYVGFTEKDFESKVDKDPAKVKAFFDKHRELFRTPEKRDLYLVVGTTADFMANASVSDDTLRKMYQDSIDSYRTPERVRARHILIKTQGKSKEDAAKAKTKAQELLTQIQHGGNFAELATKNSEDPGSAAKGGELGWLIHGQTVPSFDKTVFSLQPGQTSALVETEYGYHIIQVEEKQAAHTQSFEDAKPQLLADAQKQAASDALDRAVSAAHSDITRTPSQAEAIARKYNLRVFHEEGYTRGAPLPEVGGQPGLVNSIFSASKNGVTDITNMDAQGKQAFAAVMNTEPARNADYANVQADVLEKYTTAEAQRLANEAAKAAADRAKKGESLEAIAKSYGVQVKTAAAFTIDGAAEGIGSGSTLQAAFKSKVGDTVGPVNAATGQFVCKVTQSIPADMTQYAAAKDGIIQSLQQQRQGIDGPLFRDSVVSELKRKGKLKLNQELINRLVSSYQA